MKSNTQNAKITAITEKTLIVGIDVGSETHYARAFSWRGFEFSRKPLEFSNSEEGFETLKAWIEDLKKKRGLDKVIPGMEPTGHYWFNLGKFLQDNGMRPVHVNPHHVKKSNRLKNRIARWFSIYFPNYKDVYGDVGAISGLMILRAAPLPEDIVKLGVGGVNQIWRDAKLRGVGIKRARTLVEAAEHSVGSRDAQEAARIELQILLSDYDRQTKREAELMALINEKIREVPYIDKLLEIRGVGLKTVIGFVAEVGDIKRFDDPKQIQKLSGYAIVKNQSGKHKGESHISYRGRKRLRYVMYEAAVSVVSHSPEFRSIHQYYTTRDKNPLKKMQSMIAVACKLIRIFYVILKNGTKYDAAKMMGDIRRPEAA